MIIIKQFNTGSIASGNTFSKDWYSDDDYKIKYIFIKDSSNNALTGTTVTIYVGGVPITKDQALAASFGKDSQNALELNIDLPKDTKFEIQGTNGEGAATTFIIELVLEKTS